MQDEAAELTEGYQQHLGAINEIQRSQRQNDLETRFIQARRQEQEEVAKYAPMLGRVSRSGSRLSSNSEVQQRK